MGGGEVLGGERTYPGVFNPAIGRDLHVWGARGGRKGVGGSGNGRDGGKPTTPTCASRPEGLVPRAGSGGTRKMI
jgi:hypothetical protein